MKRKTKNQKGIALVTVILMLLAFTVLGVIALNVTTVGSLITRNTKTSKQAFYLAEAGIERAREFLRTRMAGGNTLSAELNSVKGADGVLADSSNASNFLNADDLPYLNTTSLGSGSFKVYLTNDSGLCTSGGGNDLVTSLTDCNDIVTLTSLSSGPDNSHAVIQVTVQRSPIPALPGAISMPGPHVSFDGGNSTSSTIAGDATHPAVAVNSIDGKNEVVAGIPSNRLGEYTGMGYVSGSPPTPSVVDPGGNSWDVWGNLPKLQGLYNDLKGMADFSSPSDQGFTLGTSADPKVVVIDGDYTVINGTSGAGILLVTGNLILQGDITYDGMLLVLGKGDITRSGGGTGTISGGIFVANIAGPDENINTTADNAWGTPSWNTSGGGTSDVDYIYASNNTAIQLLPFIRKTWKQL